MRSRILLSIAALLMAFATAPAHAQQYPSRPISIVVPFAAGGGSDLLARLVAQKLEEKLGKPVIVENRPGAATTLAAMQVVRAAPDGYTLMQATSSTMAINVSMSKKMAYEPLKDLVPVALLSSSPFFLVVNKDLPVTSVAELIALAKSKPGELRYASGGNGSAAHLAMEYFKLQTGIDLIHVPYRGTAPAVTDVLAGQVELIMTGIPAVQQPVKAGKLRALGVSTRAPLASMPGVPAIAATIPDFEAIQWYGIVAPAGTPAEIVQRLNAEINRALMSPALKSRLEAEGAEAAPITPAAFGALIDSEIKRWKPVVERSGMKPD